MAKCNNCNIEILDETEYCPLCRSVLAHSDTMENMYPDVRFRMRRLTLVSNIYLFLAICLEGVLIYINFITKPQIWWCVISGVALLYFYLVLRYAILGKSGYRSKIITLTILAVLSAIAMDIISGFHGWSVDYVLPAGIVIVDVVILCLMYFNRRNWQSYIIDQLTALVACGVMLILMLFNVITFPYYAIGVQLFTVLLFAGTMIIGDRKARQELIRRFHW